MKMIPSNSSFSLLVKPTSADCHLDCTYCFYLSRSDLYPQANHHRMSNKVLEQMVSSYMRTKQPHYIFSWQGGEPTLMGIEFFKRVVKLQQLYGVPGSVVSNGLQTNGVLIDDEFARLFGKYNFLIGISLDGPQYLHDSYRKYKSGQGSYRDVMKGIKYLRKNNVEFNILTLVTSSNVKKGKKIYHFLCENGFFYHQYIDCVAFDKKGKPLPYSITGEEWGNFLCDIYDEWIKSGINRVSIRLFDSILTYLLEGQYTICQMGRECSQYFVVEFNGDVYPCDFFVEKVLKIGNITRQSWRQLKESTIYADFASQKSKWSDQCEGCEYLFICSGDCLKNRLCIKNDSKQLSWLCKGWETFFNHALSGFQQIAEELQKRKHIG